MLHRKECVILLHGMGRTSFSMKKIESSLINKGYNVINVDYPSTKKSIPFISNTYVPEAIDKCKNFTCDRIHFITHSLGGIIVRYYLQTHKLPKGSRMVMLSPPNQGSELADSLKDFLGYKWAMGPAGQELGTHPDSILHRLKPIDIEVGVIAGNRSFEPWFSLIIPGQDDGKVSTERAKLKEMADFIVLPSTHAFIMQNSKVIKQIEHFLEYGKFDYPRKTKKD